MFISRHLEYSSQVFADKFKILIIFCIQLSNDSGLSTFYYPNVTLLMDFQFKFSEKADVIVTPTNHIINIIFLFFFKFNINNNFLCIFLSIKRKKSKANPSIIILNGAFQLMVSKK